MASTHSVEEHDLTSRVGSCTDPHMFLMMLEYLGNHSQIYDRRSLLRYNTDSPNPSYQKKNFRAKAKMLKNTKMLDYMKEICDDLSEMGDDMSEMVGDIDDNRTQILKEYTEKKEKIQGMRLIMKLILYE